MRPRGLYQRDRFTPRPRFTDDAKIVLLLEQRVQSGPQDGVIVRENNFDRSPTAGGIGPEHRDTLPSRGAAPSGSKFYTRWEGLRGRHNKTVVRSGQLPDLHPVPREDRDQHPPALAVEPDIRRTRHARDHLHFLSRFITRHRRITPARHQDPITGDLESSVMPCGRPSVSPRTATVTCLSSATRKIRSGPGCNTFPTSSNRMPVSVM